MIGNLDEWCHDWHGDYLGTEGHTTEPHGPATGQNRINRGGAFNVGQPYLRLASRNWFAPDNLWWVVGVRVARTVMP